LKTGLPAPLTGDAAKLRMADKQAVDQGEVSSWFALDLCAAAF
jgi:hypothetical protein